MQNPEKEPTQWQCIKQPAEGSAVCFDMQASIQLRDGRSIATMVQGFLICHQGKLQAWQNTCPHAGSPLDWIPGKFFSEDGEKIICHTHGASFDPLSGDCLSGPCERGLYPLPFREHEEGVDVPLQLP